MKRNQRHSRDSMMHGMTPRDTPTPAEPAGRPSPAAHLGTLTGSLCPRDVKGVSFFSITEGTCPGAEKREQHHELPLRALDGHVRPSAPSVHPRPHAGRRTHTLPLETSRRRHRALAGPCPLPRASLATGPVSFPGGRVGRPRTDACARCCGVTLTGAQTCTPTLSARLPGVQARFVP